MGKRQSLEKTRLGSEHSSTYITEVDSSSTETQQRERKKKNSCLWGFSNEIYQKYENRVTTDPRTKKKRNCFNFFPPKELNISEIQERKTRVGCKQQRLFDFFFYDMKTSKKEKDQEILTQENIRTKGVSALQ